MNHYAPPADELEPVGLGAREALQGVVRLLRVAEYRQQTILLILAGTLSIGAAYYAFAPRYFRSEARVMVLEQKGDDVASVGDQSDVEGVMVTHRELVRSPIVIQRAIETLSPEHRIDLMEEPPEDWVETLTDHLSTNNVRKTNFINVAYDSLDPGAAAAVVRSVIDSYRAFVEETHRGTAADVLEVLTVERDQLESDLATKQHALSAARQRVGHLALPDKEGAIDPIIARAIRMNDALMTVQQQRVALQASLASVQGAIARGEDLWQHMAAVQSAVGEQMMLSAMGLGESERLVVAEQQNRMIELQSELQRVSQYLGPSHPSVTAIRAQIGSVNEYLANHRSAAGRPGAMPDEELGPLLVQTLTQAVSQVAENERRLDETFKVARAEAAHQSGDLVKLQMLEREVSRLESLHDLLFDKIATVDIRQVQAPIRVTIVQEPLPATRPSSPQLGVVLALSLVGGLTLGFATAFIQDLADDRFGSPDEMAAQLRSRVLAVVRFLDPIAGEGLQSVQMFVNSQAVAAEAFRTLRTSISLSGETSERLVISSSEPGDGKTTTSANLAVSYAQSGKRTLIIDSDLRKPGMTALMRLKGKPGVTDILSATGDVVPVIERCLQHTDQPNLDILPVGPRRPDPAELLLGPNFEELLAWADSRYDQILIDCPPVLAVSDAQIVSRLVDGVILVVSPEKNHRRLVTRAVESFRGSGATLIGLVANRISDQASRGYGYGYGYGYGHTEEQEDNPTLPHAA